MSPLSHFDDEVPVSPDALSSDWAKRTWDWPDVRTIDQLRKVIAGMGMSVEEFKASPMVKNLEDPFYLDLIAEL